MRRVESDRRSCLPLGRFSAERRCISVFPPGVEPGLSPPRGAPPTPLLRTCVLARAGGNVSRRNADAWGEGYDGRVRGEMVEFCSLTDGVG